MATKPSNPVVDVKTYPYRMKRKWWFGYKWVRIFTILYEDGSDRTYIAKESK